MKEKNVFIKSFVVVAAIVILCEIIGRTEVKIGEALIVFFPMLYAVILGLLITPDLLGKKFSFLRKIVNEKEVNLTGEVVGIALIILGIKYGTMVGPNMSKIIQAGPAFLAQELGHILSPLIALPLALLLGLKREAIGAASSISREPSLGVITEKYGINSPEGSGVLGTYLVGTVLGTIYFSILGSVSIYSGLHPYALGMATGVGSGSMMTAAASSLAAVVPPEMAETVVAYGATSNMLSGITGINFLVFVSLPFANWYYEVLEPRFSKR